MYSLGQNFYTKNDFVGIQTKVEIKSPVDHYSAELGNLQSRWDLFHMVNLLTLVI